ncbi:hypothetical protein GCM10009785_32910 [Brooklawnia cerclae]|uniref:Uncharacterized protein n=1 Tax=Brooklawnia cerclae TaxID=349934 RepID=A0ABX0SHK2_9ACTN|nr:hypothetical protein [Brooklawnia cerclae]NIH57436.1 hypothetical protein [Brooklawnia cerclae]
MNSVGVTRQIGQEGAIDSGGASGASTGARTDDGPLAWGPWSAKLADRELFGIEFDGSRVLDGVRLAVRDPDWYTLRGVVETEDQVWTDDGLSVTVVERLTSDDADLTAEIRFAIENQGASVGLRLRALRDSAVNRAGLVALLPGTLAGSDLTVDTVDGYSHPLRLPVQVSPYQPCLGIKGLRWTRDGVDVEVDFAGDTFEMEDQRNWCDFSFKVYNRPLGLPFPYMLRKDAVISQSVVARARHAPQSEGRRISAASPRSWRSVDGGRGGLPTFDLGASTRFLDSPPSADLGCEVPDALVLEVTDRDPLGRIAEQARRETRGAGIPLDLRVRAGSEAGLESVLDFFGQTDLRIARLAAFDASTLVTESDVWRSLVRLNRSFGAELVAGTCGHFAEFNRNVHRFPSDADGYCFSLSPQMHVQEQRHIREVVDAIPGVIASARELVEGRPLLIGPITLRPRLNAVATREGGPGPSDLAGFGPEYVSESTDARQGTPFAGAWTAACLAQLIGSEVAEVCLYESSGPRGIREPDGHLSACGEAIEWFLGHRRGTIHELGAFLPTGAYGVVAARDGTGEILLTNPGCDEIDVPEIVVGGFRFPGIVVPACRVRIVKGEGAMG